MNKWIQFNFDTPDESHNSKCSDTKSMPVEFDDLVPQVKTFNFENKLHPNCVQDLAVHKKKVCEIECWLQDNIINPKKKCNASILLISGPTGCGKTTTVKLLCKVMNIEILEWINPIDKDFELFRAPGQSAQFLEFLLESKYPSLFCLNGPKITVVEDYPNSVIRDPSEFAGILEKCYDQKLCIVFICTDSSSFKLNLSQSLFPQQIRDKYSIDSISFNPCSHTILKQALKRAQIIIQENLDTLRPPAPTTIENIVSSANGDIRCAINQFYFACLKGSCDLPATLNQSASKPGLKRKRNEKLQHRVQNMMKDESLGIFHSLGRVLNPKREEIGNKWKISHNLNSLIDELCTQPETFNALLHENYLKYFGNISDVSRAAEILSLSQTFFHNSWYKGDTFMFALWLSVLGLMVSNEHKVSKWTAITGARKMRKLTVEDLETRELPVSDYCYYGIITKSNKFHSFQLL